MNDIHPAWLIGPWLLALLAVAALGKWGGLSAPAGGRYVGIDGLRGHLALAVSLHHGVVWYGYLRTGRWEEPGSHLHNQLGQSSVALFFMITAFLFVGKLLNAGGRPIDWTRIFVSRVLRLTPLYLLALAGVLTLVAVRSGWSLNESPGAMVQPLLHWLFFTIGEAPDLNGVKDTSLMVAGVTWSLPLEWMFYLALPGLALLMRRQVPWWLACVTSLLAWSIWVNHRDPWMLRAFAIGGLCAWASRQASVQRLAAHPLASLAVALSLGFALLASQHVRATLPMLALALAFLLTSSGNTLFGILSSGLSRSLGELAYGIYLLHGLILFLAFHLVIGEARAASWSPMAHAGLLAALTPVVIATAWVAFRWVEHPCMRQTDAWTKRVQAKLGGIAASRART